MTILTSNKITYIFDVVLAAFGVRVDEVEILLGSSFDDERLPMLGRRLELSDDTCFAWDDTEAERISLYKSELGNDWTPVDDVLLNDSKLLLELAKKQKYY